MAVSEVRRGISVKPEVSKHRTGIAHWSMEHWGTHKFSGYDLNLLMIFLDIRLFCEL